MCKINKGICHILANLLIKDIIRVLSKENAS